MRDLAVEDARARILAGAPAPSPETCPLAEALGRTLLEPVAASRDQPPFDASAMDGWAVAGDGELFDIKGESAAGRAYGRPLEPGQAVRIFTGAPVPDGATRVVIQENAARDGDRVRTPPFGGGQGGQGNDNIRPRGGDFHAGDVLLRGGMRIDAWRLGLAAAAGRAQLTVARRPVVGVLSTGEEIVPVGAVPGPDHIYNSGAPTLAALIGGWGGAARVLAPAGDNADAIARAVAKAGGDVIVTIGGASVGDHDLVKPALKRLGLDLRVETVKLRPGKPTWFGLLADGRRVVGLPGNPASAFVCAELFLKPLLLAMQGAAPGPVLAEAKLSRAMPASGPREHWARGRLSYGEGCAWVEPMADQDSSLVTVFAEAQVLIRRRAGEAAAGVGAVVDVLMLGRL